MSSGSWGSPGRGKNPATKGFAATDPQENRCQQGSEDVRKIVTLTERELRAAAQLLSSLAGLEGDRGRELTKILEKAAGIDRYHDRALLVERARQTFADRSQRSQFFNSVMFGEAAWEMLLALYVTEQSGARHTVSGLVNLSGVPPTTALRWLDFLRQEQLVTRRSNPTDRRVVYIELTDEGLKALDEYFSATMAATM